MPNWPPHPSSLPVPARLEGRPSALIVEVGAPRRTLLPRRADHGRRWLPAPVIPAPLPRGPGIRRRGRGRSHEPPGAASTRTSPVPSSPEVGVPVWDAAVAGEGVDPRSTPPAEAVVLVIADVVLRGG
ncbi:hypothetical protein BDA96_06G121200 [Sorghum bicolor]|uniref:Uncharacterized protein n=1 Tax=Sorghum bicolor TaxID=4558 RepID=A0A921QQU9_SORBI|nr:hypothetical protein BDA96_06G121200 [Sorghum bicolor]